MIFVVAGPTITQFTRLVTNIVSMGTKKLHLFASAKVPLKPDAVPRGDLATGYVRARMTGSAVCSEK